MINRNGTLKYNDDFQKYKKNIFQQDLELKRRYLMNYIY